MNVFKISVYLIFLLLASSCQKNQDENPPVILITSPTEGALYQVLDNVAIRANVSDDKIIKSIQVSLIDDMDNRKVLNSLFFSPNQPNFNLEATFTIDDSLLETGRYYFRVEAMDENNTSAAFQYIQVNGIPKIKLGALVICSSPSFTTVYSDKNDLSFSNDFSFNAPYFNSTINNYDQQLWFLPDGNSNFLAYQLNENTIEFDQPVMSGFVEAYTDVKLNGRGVLVSTKDGELIGYSPNYTKNYNYQTLSDRMINRIGVSKDYIIVDETDLNGGNRFANVLFGNTGVVRFGISINYACVDIYFLESERALLFQNDENGGRISELNIEATARRTVRTFPDSILRVEQISNDEYALSTRSKILRYDFGNDNLLDYLNIGNAVMKFENLNNQLYVASGNKLEIYDYPFQTLAAHTVLPKSITGLEIRYNK